MRFRFLPIPLAVFLLNALAASGDGVYISKLVPSGYAQDITEPTQKAVIVHFGGKERLVLQVSYRGSVSKFAWLVPTPAAPELKVGDSNVFHLLHRITGSRVRYWFEADKIVYSTLGVFGGYHSRLARPSTVDVLERKVIGGYDVAVLRAKSGLDLLKWLRANGYQVTDKLGPVLADYIRRGWVFTAARIDTGSQAKNAARLKEGSLAPLQLEFPSKDPIYPLKVSSLNPGRTNILLYVVADHFVTGSPLRTVCAVDNRSGLEWMVLTANVRSQAKETLRRNVPVDSRGSSRYCITKLAGDLEPGQMTNDLALVPSDSQERILPPGVSAPLLDNLGALVLAPIALVFWFPVNIVVAAVCLVVSLAPAGQRRSSTWQVAAGAFLVGWLPANMLVNWMFDLCFWPVGIAAIAGAVLLAGLTVRRAVHR